MSIVPEVRVGLNALVGEGPIWDSDKRVLWWIDVLSSELYAFDPANGSNRTWNTGRHVGTVVPWTETHVLLALRDGIGSLELETGRITVHNDPESNLPGNRFNDGKCDPAGRLWAGTMAYDNPTDQGSLYRIDTDFNVTKILGGIGISNGIVWSADQSTMYYIDSMSYKVRTWNFDPESGGISGEQTLLEVEPDFGLPDGMTIDEEGHLWVAFYGGSQVCRVHAQSGAILDTIDLPARNITACAFGDDDLGTLYITSAAQQMSNDELAAAPMSGNLFSCRPGIKGMPAVRFGG